MNVRRGGVGCARACVRRANSRVSCLSDCRRRPLSSALVGPRRARALDEPTQRRRRPRCRGNAVDVVSLVGPAGGPRRAAVRLTRPAAGLGPSRPSPVQARPRRSRAASQGVARRRRMHVQLTPLRHLPRPGNLATSTRRSPVAARESPGRGRGPCHECSRGEPRLRVTATETGTANAHRGQRGHHTQGTGASLLALHGRGPGPQPRGPAVGPGVQAPRRDPLRAARATYASDGDGALYSSLI